MFIYLFIFVFDFLFARNHGMYGHKIFANANFHGIKLENCKIKVSRK